MRPEAAVIVEIGSAIPDEIQPLGILAFKFAVLTSVDAEHTSSVYKCLLSNRCGSFTAAILEMVFLAYHVYNYMFHYALELP